MQKTEILDKIKDLVEKLNSPDYFVVKIERWHLFEQSGEFVWHGDKLLFVQESFSLGFLVPYYGKELTAKELSDCLKTLKQFKVIEKKAVKPILV